MAPSIPSQSDSTSAQATADHRRLCTTIGCTSVNGALSAVVRMVHKRLGSSSCSGGVNDSTMLSNPLDLATLEPRRFCLYAYTRVLR